MVEMNSVEGEERRMVTNGLFWTERLLLLLLVVFPTYVVDLILFLIFFTTLFTLTSFFFCPNLSSVGVSGIGGFWLFLLDRSTFYLGFEYSKLLAQGFEIAFLWRFIVFLSVVVHAVYIVDHLLRSHQAVPQSQNDETPIYTGDASKEMERVKELVEDGKQMIQSGLETLRKEWGEFRDDGKKMMTLVDVVENMISSQSQPGTLRDNMRLNADEIWAELRDDLRSKVYEVTKACRQDFDKDVKSAAEQLHETYLAIQETAKDVKNKADQLLETYLEIQETAKEAKITAEKPHETYFIFQEGEKKRRMIRGEDVEGFSELREEVRRMSVEAEVKAEELSRATVELVEAGIQQWEDDNADYLASLPLLYCNRT